MLNPLRWMNIFDKVLRLSARPAAYAENRRAVWDKRVWHLN